MSKEKNIKGISMPTRPRTFGEFWEASVKAEGLNENMKYLRNRNDWLKSIKENKSKQILDKIPVDELPECEEIDDEHSQIGNFISQSQFSDIYDEDGEILDGLGENGVLCYCSVTGARTWWQVKDKEGLVRIK